MAHFLSERGLELSHEKTSITQIEGGFDFLSLLTSVPALLAMLGSALGGAVVLFIRRRRDGSDSETLTTNADSSSSKKRAAVAAPKHEEAETAASKPFKHTAGDRPWEPVRADRNSDIERLASGCSTDGVRRTGNPYQEDSLRRLSLVSWRIG